MPEKKFFKVPGDQVDLIMSLVSKCLKSTDPSIAKLAKQILPPKGEETPPDSPEGPSDSP